VFSEIAQLMPSGRTGEFTDTPLPAPDSNRHSSQRASAHAETAATASTPKALHVTLQLIVDLICDPHEMHGEL
jgi:hypothetical protein